MALDPNEIVQQGTWEPGTADGKPIPDSITAPDGVDKTSNQFYAQYKVYRDGHRVIQWYKRGTGDGKNDPVMTTTGEDGSDMVPAVKKTWDEDSTKDAAATRAAGAPATRTVNGVPSQVVGKDANGQDIWAPVQTANGPATATSTATGTGTSSNPRVPAGSVPRIEGTPDPSKPEGRDNSTPVRAWHAPDGSVVYEPLTPAEVLDWQRQKNGGKTDAEMTQAQVAGQGAAARAEVPGHPGIWEVKTQKPATATSPAITESHYEDSSGKTVPRPPDVKPGQVATLDGQQVWVTPNADPSKPPTITRLDPGVGTQPQDNGPKFTPGQSPSDYLNARRAWLMDQRRAGVSQKDINDIWDRDVQIATAKQNEAATAATQQNQRLSSSMSGFNQATSAVENINKYLPVGSDLGGRALEAFLGLQRGQAQRMGGYGPDPSSQVAAIPPAPAASPTAGARYTPEQMGMLATNEANRRQYEASHAGAPGAQPAAAGGPPPPLSQGQDLSTPPPGGVNPPVGQPGNNPAQPVGMAPQLAAPIAAIPEDPYSFQARIASTPPWQMDENTYRQAQSMGLGQQFWAVPGSA